MEILFIATVIEVTVVFIAFLVLYIGSYLIQNKQTTTGRRLKAARGIEARALILKVEETGMAVNQQLPVTLQVQVLPERGRNFVTEIKTIMSGLELRTIKSGSMITVFYDPSNTKEVAFVNINRN